MTDHSSEMELQEVEKKVPINTSDSDQHSEYWPKILNILKNNKDGGTSAIKIKKLLKIKAKPRRIEFNNCLKLAIQKGDLEQVAGKGANGSFRLPTPKNNKNKKDTKFQLKPK